mgnify:CR=1 FL=1
MYILGDPQVTANLYCKLCNLRYKVYAKLQNRFAVISGSSSMLVMVIISGEHSCSCSWHRTFAETYFSYKLMRQILISEIFCDGHFFRWWFTALSRYRIRNLTETYFGSLSVPDPIKALKISGSRNWKGEKEEIPLFYGLMYIKTAHEKEGWGQQ